MEIRLDHRNDMEAKVGALTPAGCDKPPELALTGS